MSGVATTTIIAGAALAVTAAGTIYSMTQNRGGGSSGGGPQPQMPNVPAYTDPAIQAAANAQQTAAANSKGRQSTILTSGEGDTSQATTQKKTLLGVG